MRNIMGVAGCLLLAATQATAAPAAKSMPTTAPARAQAAPTAIKESPAAREAARKKKALREGWPDTPAGMVASGWVEAFSSGEEAMRSFLAANVAAADLAKRPIEERIAKYRKLRERFGALELAAVEKSAASELTVTLLAADASAQRFVFTVAKEPPHALVSVSFFDRVNVHGGHGFHH